MDLGAYTFGKVQPQAVELEQAVLGALLTDRTAMRAVHFLEPQHFYKDEHRMIYDAIKKLWDSGSPVDLLTVGEQLKKDGNDTASGGFVYLSNLSARVASSVNIEAHARIVQQKWIMRSLIGVGNETIQNAYTETKDALELLDETSLAISKIRKLEDFRGMRGAEAVEILLEAAKKAYETKGEILGRPMTGIKTLDTLMQGAEAGDYIVVGARPKMGKSSFLNACLKQHVIDGSACYCISGEMQNVVSVARLSAAISGLPTNVVRSGEFFGSQEQLAKFEYAYEKVRDSKIIFDDGGLSLPKIRSLIAQGEGEGVRNFYFDRLELFQEFITAGNNWLPALKQINSTLRDLANKYKVTICSFVQGNLDGEKVPGKRMLAQHFYGGTPVQEAVTKALAIYRPEGFGLENFEAGPFEGLPAKGRAEIYMLLATSYETGSAMVGFSGATQLFYEVANEADPFPNSPDEVLPF